MTAEGESVAGVGTKGAFYSVVNRARAGVVAARLLVRRKIPVVVIEHWGTGQGRPQRGQRGLLSPLGFF